MIRGLYHALPALCLVFLLCPAPPAGAAFDAAKWTWQCELDTSRAEAGFVRLTVLPEMFDGSQPDLDDLRILDDRGDAVPHVIHWGRTAGRQETRWRQVALLNPTYVPGRYSRVVLDFGRPTVKNLVRVSLEGTNYRRRILVEGSTDSLSWEMVAEDRWLIRIDQDGETFRIDTVRFPENNFRYLRLTLFHERDDQRRIDFTAVESGYSENALDAELLPVPVRSFRVSRDEKQRMTVVTLDLGSRNLPLARLTLRSPDAYYHRAYELRGRNGEKETHRRHRESGWEDVEREVPWRSVRRGVVYRILHDNRASEANVIDATGAPFRHLQLRIFDQDNPPLVVEGVDVERRDVSLVFRLDLRRTYRLIGGCPSARPPDYDLDTAVKGVDGFRLPMVGVAGPPAPLSHEPAPLLPWSERHRWLLIGVLALAVAVMVSLIFRSARQIGRGG